MLAKFYIAALATVLAATAAHAQPTLLQSGPWVPGHAPVYVGQGSSQPVVQDSGTAGGGASGVGLGELGITIRNPANTYPAANVGKGPFNTNICDYDAPVTNATGFHFLCMSPNAQGGGLIAYGAGGIAPQLPFNFSVNGSLYHFPYTVGGIVGPNSSVVGNIPIWNNTTGSVLGSLATANSAVLATNSSGVPSLTATLPSAVQSNITALGTIATGVWNGTVLANSNLAQMPAYTTKCNPTGSLANAQDCTGAQFTGVPIYTNPGAGAVAESLKTRFQNEVWASDFGAKCDGTTDDQAAIQAAITAGQTIGFTKVNLPAGVCIIGSTITINNIGSGTGNTWLQGSGINGTILRGKSTFTASGTLINVAGNNSVISDLHIDGNHISGINGVVMLSSTITSGQMSVIERNKFDGFDTGSANAVVMEGGYFRILDNMFVANATDILLYSLTDSGGASNGLISENFSNTSNTFVEVNNQSAGSQPQGILISDNHGIDNIYGVVSNSTLSLNIEGNILDRVGGATSFVAVALIGQAANNANSDVKVIGNWLAGTNYAIYVGDYMYGLNIADNFTAPGPDTAVSEIKLDCTVLGRCQDIHIVGNTFNGYNSANQSVTLNYTQRVQIAANSMAGGIVENGGGSDVKVFGNTLGGTSTQGIAAYLFNTGGTGYGNQVTVSGTGALLSAGPLGGVGYATGAGGTVTQATSKATGVTLNKVTGAITLNAAALDAGTIVSFTLTDSAIAATDVLVLNHISGGTAGAYGLNAQAAAGSASINVLNATAGSLSEAIVIKFAVIKGANS